MADLAKYREVKHVTDNSDLVSILLTEGWELVSAKIVEEQFKMHSGDEDGCHIVKEGRAHYILGLPRNHRTPAQRAQDEKTRELFDQ